MIVFYDFEYDTVKKAKAKGVTLGKNECIAFTKAFCEYVESHGYKAGVYSNIDYHRNMYSDEVLSKYVYWLADYTGSPDYDCAFHQYTSSGTVSGLDGKVDMDYYYGEKSKRTRARRNPSLRWQRKCSQETGETEMTARIDWLLPDMTTQRCRQK